MFVFCSGLVSPCYLSWRHVGRSGRQITVTWWHHKDVEEREVFRNYFGQNKLWLFSADQSREMNVSSDLQKTKESVQTFSVNKRRFDLIFLMQYSLKCFMETRRVSHSFSCSTTLTEFTSLSWTFCSPCSVWSHVEGAGESARRGSVRIQRNV